MHSKLLSQSRSRNLNLNPSPNLLKKHQRNEDHRVVDLQIEGRLLQEDPLGAMDLQQENRRKQNEMKIRHLILHLLE
jgi:hypothetical protein